MIETRPHQLPLSPRQQQLVETIDRLTSERGGLAPTLREVASEMNIHFTRAHSLAHSTASKGRLVHEPGIPRSWRTIPAQEKPKAAKSRSRK
jgi:hypothetical protein